MQPKWGTYFKFNKGPLNMVAVHHKLTLWVLEKSRSGQIGMLGNEQPCWRREVIPICNVSSSWNSSEDNV